MPSIDFFDYSLDLLEDFGLANLFLETILPLIIIIGYFTTIRGARAVVVNSYCYRYQSVTKDGTEKWVCMTDGCSSTISWLNGKVVKINGAKVFHNPKLPPHNHKGIDTCKYSDNEIKSKFINSERANHYILFGSWS